MSRNSRIALRAILLFLLESSTYYTTTYYSLVLLATGHHSLYTIFMKWAQRRKIVYGLSVGVFVIAIAVYFSKDLLFPTPTCTDTKQNGYETGIDCGGACALRCTTEVQVERVVWAQALPTGPSTYDLVALVANKNIDTASENVSYRFTVYNTSGEVLLVATGTALTQLDSEFPVIIQNVTLPEEPKNVIATLITGKYYKVTNTTLTPLTRTTNIRYEKTDVSRVYATVANATREPFSNLPVRVLLFDIEGNAYAAGETVIPYLDKESSKMVSFTWGSVFPKDPSRIRIYPIIDPFAR